MLRQVVAEALEKNSMVTSVTVDPGDDRIDDRVAKAWCVSVRGANCLTTRRHWNFSVHLRHPFSNKREMVILSNKQPRNWALNCLYEGFNVLISRSFRDVP